MSIDEAIKILSERFHDPTCKFDDDYYDAIQLGIEALKRIRSQYDPDHQHMRIPLPGETRE